MQAAHSDEPACEFANLIHTQGVEGVSKFVQALVSVAKRFLLDIPDVEDSARESLAQHMAFAHLSVAEESKRCCMRSLTNLTYPLLLA